MGCPREEDGLDPRDVPLPDDVASFEVIDLDGAHTALFCGFGAAEAELLAPATHQSAEW